jgi:hypothetical protein
MAGTVDLAINPTRRDTEKLSSTREWNRIALKKSASVLSKNRRRYSTPGGFYG